MRRPSPGLNRFLGYGTAMCMGVYFIMEILILKRPPSGPYPYWTSVSGAALMSFLIIKLADEEVWVAFLIGALSFAVGFIALIHLLLNL